MLGFRAAGAAALIPSSARKGSGSSGRLFKAFFRGLPHPFETDSKCSMNTPFPHPYNTKTRFSSMSLLLSKKVVLPSLKNQQDATPPSLIEYKLHMMHINDIKHTIVQMPIDTGTSWHSCKGRHRAYIQNLCNPNRLNMQLRPIPRITRKTDQISNISAYALRAPSVS